MDSLGFVMDSMDVSINGFGYMGPSVMSLSKGIWFLKFYGWVKANEIKIKYNYWD
jgi:hypothetical protein